MFTPRVSTSRFVLTAITCVLLALPAIADSQARIVRLSDVQGSVQIDKNNGAGFERAFLNLPITQGVLLQTSDNGRAEIEFEDGSALRLAPNSKVEFSTLGLSDSGKRVSAVNLIQGMAYVNWLSKNDDLTLNFSNEKVELTTPAHFRVEASKDTASLAVFKGDVAVDGPSGKVTIGKKKMATFDASDADKFSLAKLEEDPLDSWDKEASEYHQQYAKNNSSPYGYGYSDLNYYGNFRTVSGYGTLWQPYFAGAGWDPFMDGAWSYYPGYGYMYVSAYPWGWLPYRYGNWVFVPGAGWMWQAGSWNSWTAVPRYVGTTPATFRRPVAPTGTVKTLSVGRGPVLSVPVSRTIVNGSAGMGIARGSLENLHHLSGQVAKAGRVEVAPTPQFANTNTGRTANTVQLGAGSAAGPATSRVGTSPAVGSAAPASHAPSSHPPSGGGHRN